MTDLTASQTALLHNMRAGSVLKQNAAGDMLIVGRFTSMVLKSTVNSLVKAGRIRDTHRLDEKGNRIFEVCEPPLASKPAGAPTGWPFPSSSHGWDKP